MNRLIYSIISYFTYFFPTKKTILFSSFPDFSDNAFALYKYMEDIALYKEFSFYWLVLNKDDIRRIKIEIIEKGYHAQVISKHSIKALWIYLRCRYVFTTHGVFSNIITKQHKDKIVNLWHGMPIKKIALDAIPPSTLKNVQVMIASSDLFKPIMAKSFGISVENSYVVGQPRCDLLFEETDFFKVNNIDRDKYHSVGLWLPTFRKSIVGMIRCDGKFEEGTISFLTKNDLCKLNSFLSSKKNLLIIKLHPMDALVNYHFNNYSNIIVIRPSELKTQLYPLLGSCDYLLTDFSSVFIDYDIVKKPIGFIVNDLKEYKHSRGLYFDFEEIIPGQMICTYKELCKFIENPIRIDSKILLNKFNDNKSSYRLLKKLNIIK